MFLGKSSVISLSALTMALIMACSLVVTGIVNSDDDVGSDGSLKLGRFTFMYESIPIYFPLDSKNLIGYWGKVIVHDETGETVYSEKTGLAPTRIGVPFPPLSTKPAPTSTSWPIRSRKELVIFSGSRGGRHPTLKIFVIDPIAGLRTTALDFEYTNPNLSDIDGDGQYEAKVFRRHMLNGGPLDTCLIIYRLVADENMFGFVPVFGGPLAKDYLEHYAFLRRRETTIPLKERIGPILAALVASGDKERICSEVSTLVAEGVDAIILNQWSKRLIEAGYPYVDLQACVRRQ